MVGSIGDRPGPDPTGRGGPDPTTELPTVAGPAGSEPTTELMPTDPGSARADGPAGDDGDQTGR